jgi:hypothetical protein
VNSFTIPAAQRRAGLRGMGLPVARQSARRRLRPWLLVLMLEAAVHLIHRRTVTHLQRSTSKLRLKAMPVLRAETVN